MREDYRDSLMFLTLLVASIAVLTACSGGATQPPTRRPAPEAAKTRTPVLQTLRGKVIVLDPGHNGSNWARPSVINAKVDVGNGRKECDTTGTASASGYTEHAYTWDVSVRLRKILRSHGAKVVMTRSNDTGVGPCIDRRAAIGNQSRADVALSIHADGAPKSSRGFHIIAPGPVKGHTEKFLRDSRRLALALRAAFLRGTNIPYSNYIGKDAINVRDDLGGLNLSTVPKVFIETGNMANPQDIAKLSDPSFRQRIAKSLANGLAAYFA